MLLCNGCSKTGTHLLTSIAKAVGYATIGGTLIYRSAEKGLHNTGRTPLQSILGNTGKGYIHGHVIADETSFSALSGHRHLHVVRNPRDVSISWMRHLNRGNPEKPVNADQLARLIRGGMFGRSIVGMYTLFLPWLDRSDTLTVRFERLAARDADEYRRIFDYLGCEPFSPEDFRLGESSTATGALSDWRSSPHWTPAVEAAWAETGGPALEDRLGYR